MKAIHKSTGTICHIFPKGYNYRLMIRGRMVTVNSRDSIVIRVKDATLLGVISSNKFDNKFTVVCDHCWSELHSATDKVRAHKLSEYNVLCQKCVIAKQYTKRKKLTKNTYVAQR
jgi:hypothetical protein